jgi:oxygen-dependent protoporphyrinogen oxidase
MSRRIAVIGGGIGGLACAYRWHRAHPQDRITVHEASARWGGTIRTLREDGLTCDLGPDSLLRRPAVERLFHDLGLADQQIGVRPQARRSLIAGPRGLAAVPEGFYLLAPGRILPFLASPLVSPLGKLRMLVDLALPRRAADAPEESLAAFVRRRLGAEALERLAQPMVAGITTADPEQLSVAAAFPQLLEMERTHRSLLLAMRARLGESEAAGARYGLFLSLRDGMEQLVTTLVAALSACALRNRSAVTAVARAPGGWRLATAHGEEDADQVVLAVPAAPAARLLTALAPAAAAALAAIPHASVATVLLAYRRSDCPRLPEAAGFVVPTALARSVIAATLVDRKFEHRADPGRVLVRAFIGGAQRPGALAGGDAELAQQAHADCARLLGIAAPPLRSLVARYGGSMPQYILGHLGRAAEVRSALAAHPGLHLLCNAVDGIGIGALLARAEGISAS